jgi:hypothetical protein
VPAPPVVPPVPVLLWQGGMVPAQDWNPVQSDMARQALAAEIRALLLLQFVGSALQAASQYMRI